MKKYFLLFFLVATTATLKPLLQLTSPDVGIDLGTQNTLIAIIKNGDIQSIADVPSVVAIDKKTKRVIAVGKEAKNMLGKAPQSISVVRPMQDGVIQDFDVAEAMLQYIFETAVDYQPGLLRGPRMVIGIPCSITDPEVRAITDIAKKAGAREVYTIMEPMAAAIGAELPIEEAQGTMVVDIGGGTTDILVVSLKSPVICRAIRVAGDKFDASIQKYIRDKYNLKIGEQTAGKIKEDIGAVWIQEGTPVRSMEIAGADVVTGMIRTITITSADVLAATNDNVRQILNAIKEVLNNIPPELASDIAKQGIFLAGGGALFRGMDKRIQNDLGVKVQIPSNPLHAIIDGIAKVVRDIDYYRDSLFEKEDRS